MKKSFIIPFLTLGILAPQIAYASPGSEIIPAIYCLYVFFPLAIILIVIFGISLLIAWLKKTKTLSTHKKTFAGLILSICSFPFLFFWVIQILIDKIYAGKDYEFYLAIDDIDSFFKFGSLVPLLILGLLFLYSFKKKQTYLILFSFLFFIYLFSLSFFVFLT